MAQKKEYSFIGKTFNGGKVTIPQGIRNVLKIHDGQQIEVVIKLLDEEEEQ